MAKGAVMPMENEETFKKRKLAVLDAARAEGIVDVVTAGGRENSISLETVELATSLVKKHRKIASERLETEI